MIKENAYLIIAIIAFGFIVATFLAIIFANALTETRRLIRMRHNSHIVSNAQVLFWKLYKKASNNNVFKSNVDDFQRALGGIEDRMYKMDYNDNNPEYLSVLIRKVATLSAIFANVYSKQSHDDKKALEKVYKCIDHNLQVLIANLEHFQDIYDIPRIVDLIPVSKETAASFRTHNENSLVFIEDLFTYDHIACEAVEPE